MIIDKVTITGADDATDIQEMLEFSRRFDRIEWGILLSETKMGTPRYPSKEWLARLHPHGKMMDPVFYAMPTGLLMRMHLAMHVCGKWTKNILKNAPDEFVYKTAWNFDRIQMNFSHGEEFDPEFAKSLSIGTNNDKQYIFQVGKAGDNPAMRLAQESLDVAVLFDRSGGKGKSPDEWPAPLEGLYCGYAGGLNPDNITEELRKIAAVVNVDQHIWIDMESGVRTDDKLDMAKVEACYMAAVHQPTWDR